MKYQVGQNVKITSGNYTGKYGIIQAVLETEYKIRFISCSSYFVESQLELTNANTQSW